YRPGASIWLLRTSPKAPGQETFMPAGPTKRTSLRRVGNRGPPGPVIAPTAATAFGTGGPYPQQPACLTPGPLGSSRLTPPAWTTPDEPPFGSVALASITPESADPPGIP